MGGESCDYACNDISTEAATKIIMLEEERSPGKPDTWEREAWQGDVIKGEGNPTSVGPTSPR